MGRPYQKNPAYWDLNAFAEQARAIHGDRYSFGGVVLGGVKAKVAVTCAKHGDFLTTPDLFLGPRKQGCGKCGRERAGAARSAHGTFRSVDAFVAAARSKHGDKYDYGMVESVSRGTDRVTIICGEHGPFVQAAGRHATSGKGCMQCRLARLGKQNSAKGSYSSREAFESAARSVHGDKYSYGNCMVSRGTDRVIVTCPRHGDWTVLASNHIGHNSGCPRCKRSKGEEEVSRVLSLLGVRYITGHSFPTCVRRRRLRFDFFLPDVPALIEYDGEQHFAGGESMFHRPESAERDQIKDAWAADHKIRLLRIPYWDFDRIEEVVRSFCDATSIDGVHILTVSPGKGVA